jgi:type VI protein secretion system component VasF
MSDPHPPDGAPQEPPVPTDQRARWFGLPVIYIVLIAFAILIALLAWFDIIGGSVM